MATRMQQRRGTASQWTIADPVLAAGEIGVESDTAKFKIGDGVNVWSSLDYYETSAAAGVTFIEDSEKGANDGVATLDGTGNVPTAQLGNVDFTGYATEAYADQAEADAIAAAASDATTKADTAESNANSYTDTAISNLVNSAPGTLDTLNELAAALNDDASFATTVTNAIATKQDDVITTEGDLAIGDNTGTAVRLPIGPATYILQSDGTTANWVEQTGGGADIYKGPGNITVDFSAGEYLLTSLVDAKVNSEQIQTQGIVRNLPTGINELFINSPSVQFEANLPSNDFNVRHRYLANINEKAYQFQVERGNNSQYKFEVYENTGFTQWQSVFDAEGDSNAGSYAFGGDYGLGGVRGGYTIFDTPIRVFRYVGVAENGTLVNRSLGGADVPIPDVVVATDGSFTLCRDGQVIDESDGSTTQASLPGTPIGYAGGHFWCANNQTLSRSTDAINWTTVSTAISSEAQFIIYADGYYFAATADQILNYSSDGSTWQTVDLSSFTATNLTGPPAGNFYDYPFRPRFIYHANNKFFITLTDGEILYADKTDLSSWTKITNPTWTRHTKIYYFDGIYYAFTDSYQWSEDLLNWTSVPYPVTVQGALEINDTIQLGTVFHGLANVFFIFDVASGQSWMKIERVTG